MEQAIGHRLKDKCSKACSIVHYAVQVANILCGIIMYTIKEVL